MSDPNMGIDATKAQRVIEFLGKPENDGVSNREAARILGVNESYIRRAKAHAKGEVMKIDPRKLRIDLGTQLREQINQGVVDTYAEHYANGVTLPKIDVFQIGKDSVVADGFHRTLGAIAAELKSIEVMVHQGTLRDAVLFAAGANSAHGLHRSNADKRRAVATLLKDQEWGQWSDNKIAKACGVSSTFVGDQRSIYSPTKDTGERKAERNGKEYTVKTDAIGKKPKPEADKPKEVAEAPEADPVEHGTAPISSPTKDSRPEAIAAKPEFEGEEPETPKPPTDAEWLATLPCRAKLNDRCRAIFDRGALIYRTVVESAEFDAFAKLVKSQERLVKTDTTKPDVLYRLGRSIEVPHPRTWLVCGTCNGVGCDTCHRRGHVVGSGG